MGIPLESTNDVASSSVDFAIPSNSKNQQEPLAMLSASFTHMATQHVMKQWF